LKGFGYSDTIVAAGWLHDVVEDTDFGLPAVEIVFGTDVAILVMEVTNVYIKKTHHVFNREQRKKLEAVRLSGVSNNAKIIKLADRLCNLLDYTPGDDDEWWKLYTNETRQLLPSIRAGNEILAQRIEALING
jgi:guanosine-3',5'-bis(diphosphate) 3'-pyrophosphohydrolase